MLNKNYLYFKTTETDRQVRWLDKRVILYNIYLQCDGKLLLFLNISTKVMKRYYWINFLFPNTNRDNSLLTWLEYEPWRWDAAASWQTSTAQLPSRFRGKPSLMGQLHKTQTNIYNYRKAGESMSLNILKMDLLLKFLFYK